MNSKYSARVAFILSFCASFFTIRKLFVFAADDSYIHKRIAAHLHSSGYAYFNANEPVMVTSSPLWTWVLALLSWTRHLDAAVMVTECLSIAWACTMAILLTRQATKGKAAWVRNAIGAGAMALTFVSLFQSTVHQMETPLAFALLLTGLVLLENGNAFWLTFLCLAASTRYEFYILIALALVASAAMRKLKWQAVAFAAVAFVLTNVWVFWQYRTLVPNTVRAKAVGYAITWQESMRSFGLGRFIILALVILFVLMFLDRKKMQLSSLLLFSFGLFLSAIYIVRHTYMFAWYLPLSQLTIMLGLLLGSILQQKLWIKLFAALVLCLLLTREAVPFVSEVRASITGKIWRDSSDNRNIRVQDYLAVGKALNQACPDGILMTSEIGGLGSGFQGKILDGFGLASPAALRWHPMRVPEERSSGQIGAIPMGFFLETHPDIVVTYPVFAEDLLRRYDHTEYTNLSYPSLTFLRKKKAGINANQEQGSVHVLVAVNGRCAVPTVDNAVRTELDKVNAELVR